MKHVMSIILILTLLCCVFTGASAHASTPQGDSSPVFALINTGENVVSSDGASELRSTYGDHVFLMNVASDVVDADRSMYDIVYYSDKEVAAAGESSLYPLKAASMGFGPSTDEMTNIIFVGVNGETEEDQIYQLKGINGGEGFVFVIGPEAARATVDAVDGISAFVPTDDSATAESVDMAATVYIVTASGELSVETVDLPDGTENPPSETTSAPETPDQVPSTLDLDAAASAINSYAGSLGAVNERGSQSGGVDYTGADQEELIGAGTAFVDAISASAGEAGGALTHFLCVVAEGEGCYHIEASYDTSTSNTDVVATEEPVSTPNAPEQTEEPTATALPSPDPINTPAQENYNPPAEVPTSPATPKDPGMQDPTHTRVWKINTVEPLQVSFFNAQVASISVINSAGDVQTLTERNEYALSDEGHTVMFSNSFLNSLALGAYTVKVDFQPNPLNEEYSTAVFPLLVENVPASPSPSPSPSPNQNVPIKKDWDRQSDLVLQLTRFPTGLEIKYSDTDWRPAQEDRDFYINGNVITIRADMFNGKLSTSAWAKGSYAFRIVYAEGEPQMLYLNLTTDPPVISATEVPQSTSTATPVQASSDGTVPATGDTTHLGLYIIIFVALSMILATICFILYRNRKRHGKGANRK